MALFSDNLLTEIRSRRDDVNGSFLVTLLVRDDPQTRSFRAAMEQWFREVPAAGQPRFTRLLTSVRNEDFFRGFAELAFHHLLLQDGLEVRQYPDGGARPFFLVSAPGQERDFYLTLCSFIPEGHPGYARRAYKNFIDELNRIKQRYRFAVYLRRWLPPDFEPAVVRRALENWFHRLDSDPQGGQYAEYRDGGVHVEFSILSKLNKVSDNLVGFYLNPLESQDILAGFRTAVDEECARHRRLNDRKHPLVIVLFNNDEWSLAPNAIFDFFYGKPRMSFEWSSLGGRHETVRDFTHIFASSAFNTGQGEDLAAVVLAEKIWRENGVDLKVRVLHNPWSRRPLPDSFFAGHATLRPLSGTTPEEMIIRWSNLKELTVMLT